MKQLAELKDAKYVDEHTKQLDVTTVTYNGELGMFSYQILAFGFSRSGWVSKIFTPNSVDAKPYHAGKWTLMIWDLLFVHWSNLS